MNFEQRRSTRLPLAIPIEISYVDRDGDPRLERTQTTDVDRNGARLISQFRHPIGGMIQMVVPHLGRTAHCKVVWCSAPTHRGYEIGVAIESQANLWGVPFDQRDAGGADPDPADVLWTLVQLLDEKGVIYRQEILQRMQANAHARGTSQKSESVLV